MDNTNTREITMTTTEHAKAIRTALKSQGITSRQVSVRSSLYSMGSSIDITIKDASISLTRIEDIASGHEHVRRCELSGEILNGGNRFVSVDYGHGALDQLRAALGNAVDTACTAASASPGGAITTITEHLGVSYSTSEFQLWADGHCVGSSLWNAGEVTDRAAFITARDGKTLAVCA